MQANRHQIHLAATEYELQKYALNRYGIIAKQAIAILLSFIKQHSVTTPWIPEKLGRSFFNIWIKLKLKDFQITWANILFTIEYR